MDGVQVYQVVKIGLSGWSLSIPSSKDRVKWMELKYFKNSKDRVKWMEFKFTKSSKDRVKWMELKYTKSR